MFFFYKHIRIKGLGSDMLKVTQNIGWKYAYEWYAYSMGQNF